MKRLTERLRTLLSLLVMSILLASCVTLKDYGFGECTEYTPICDNLICERDVKGCEVCTCSEDNSSDNDLLKPYPRSPRDPYNAQSR